MTRAEQITEISNRTGLSENIIRQVWKGTRESLIGAMQRQESFELHGFCTFTPKQRTSINSDGEHEIYTSVQLSGSKALKLEVRNQVKPSLTENNVDIELNIVDNAEIERDVLLYDIPALK